MCISVLATTVVVQEMHGLECGHLFCAECWDSYLTVMVMNEGRAQVREREWEGGRKERERGEEGGGEREGEREREREIGRGRECV